MYILFLYPNKILVIRKWGCFRNDTWKRRLTLWFYMYDKQIWWFFMISRMISTKFFTIFIKLLIRVNKHIKRCVKISVSLTHISFIYCISIHKTRYEIYLLQIFYYMLSRLRTHKVFLRAKIFFRTWQVNHEKCLEGKC